MSVDFAPAVAGNRRLAHVAKQLGLTAAALALLGSAAMAQTQEAPAQQTPAQQTQTSEPQTAPASTAAPTTGRSASTPAATAPEPSQASAPVTQETTPTGPTAAQPSAAQTPSTVSPSTTTEPAVTNQSLPSAAPMPQESVTELAPEEEPKPLTIPHDLSPWGMFMAADWVVKAVMIGLAIASLATWTVWLVKTLELTCARARAGSTIKIIRKSRTLAEALDATVSRGGPAAYMLRAAAEEMQLSAAALDHVEGDGVKERVGSSLSRIEAFAGRRIARGTGILATIGSTGPFVGLFGTVWGIMNAFIGISETQTTNLAVVAPGIAEALMATAIGLVAAIPAVVIYNVFARSVTGYRQLLADAAAGVERLVSRDLDFRKVPPGGRKPASMSLVAGE